MKKSENLKKRIKPLDLWFEGKTSNHASNFPLEKVVQER
jgi:hypothetical protein